MCSRVCVNAFVTTLQQDAGRLVRTYCRTDVEVDPDAVPMVLPYRTVDPGTVKVG